MPRILLVVASRGFRDEEALVPKARFEEAGCEVTVASTRSGPVRGSFGAWVTADIALAEVVVSDYAAVVFAGGEGAAELFDNKVAHRLCVDALAAGKVLGALCAAPSVLAEAGVLKECRATCWPDRRAHLESKGAILCADGVVTDPNRIVTADGPHQAAAFARTVLGLIKIS
jgi:protease I